MTNEAANVTGASWDEAAAVYANAVRDYHGRRGRSPDDPAVDATVRTNTSLVPQRAENLLRLLGELTGRSSIEGLRVLEAGSGFGALATYLAWTHQPAEFVAIDNRADFVAMATQCSAELGLEERLRFVQSDMRALHRAGPEPFDVILVNNAFIYLPTKRDMRQAIGQFHQALVPGGHVLLFHVNKWTWREPFTNAPVIHLLPARLARPLSKITGWQHNHGRVRYVSPREMQSLLRRGGFDQVKASGERERFYAAAGRRAPEDDV